MTKFTRRDFEFLARVMRKLKHKIGVRDHMCVVECMADELEATNALFNKDYFIQQSMKDEA